MRKKIKPKYPPKKFFDNEENSLRGIRAKIKNKNYTGKFFSDDAPEEIKALEKNLNDRTAPLWDVAINFMNRGEPYFYEYKFIGVKRLGVK